MGLLANIPDNLNFPKPIISSDISHKPILTKDSNTKWMPMGLTQKQPGTLPSMIPNLIDPKNITRPFTDIKSNIKKEMGENVYIKSALGIPGVLVSTITENKPIDPDYLRAKAAGLKLDQTSINQYIQNRNEISLQRDEFYKNLATPTTQKEYEWNKQPSKIWDEKLRKAEDPVMLAEYYNKKELSANTMRTGWMTEGFGNWIAMLDRGTTRMDKNAEESFKVLSPALKVKVPENIPLPYGFKTALEAPGEIADWGYRELQKGGKIVLKDVPTNIWYLGGGVPPAVERSFRDPELAKAVIAGIPMVVATSLWETPEEIKKNPRAYAWGLAGGLVTMGGLQEGGDILFSPLARKTFGAIGSPTGIVKRQMSITRVQEGDALGIPKGSPGKAIDTIINIDTIPKMSTATRGRTISQKIKQVLGWDWEYYATDVGSRDMPGTLKETNLGKTISKTPATYANPSTPSASGDILLSRVGQRFIEKARNTGVFGEIFGRGKAEIHQFTDIQTVASELSSKQKALILKQLQRERVGLDPKVYQDLLKAAQEKSNRIGQPVATLSPKRAWGAKYPEAEVIMVYGDQLPARTVTSHAFTGYTDAGTKIREIRFGTQKPIGKSLLETLAENRDYNKNYYNNYIKAAAEDMKWKSAQLKGEAFELPWEHAGHGAQHAEATLKYLLGQRSESPILKREFTVKEAKAAAKLHDIAKTGASETQPIPHGKAAAEAIRRGYFKPEETRGLNRAQVEKVATAIERHMTIEPWYSVTKPIKAIKTTLWVNPTGFEKALATADRIGGGWRSAPKTLSQKIKATVGMSSGNVVNPTRVWGIPERQGLITKTIENFGLIGTTLKTGPIIMGSPFIVGEIGATPKSKSVIRSKIVGENIQKQIGYIPSAYDEVIGISYKPVPYKSLSYTPIPYKEPTYKEKPYKEPTYKEKPYKEPTYKEKPYKEPTYKEKPYKEPTYKEKPYKEPTYKEKPYKEPTYKEKPYKEPTYKEKPYKEPTYKEKPYKEPTYKEKPYKEPTYKEKPYKEPTYKEKPYKEPTYKEKPYKEPTYKEKPYKWTPYKPPENIPRIIIQTTHELPVKRRKKRSEYPKHWEIASSAEPEDVTEFIFGSGSGLFSGSKKPKSAPAKKKAKANKYIR
jgi:hypothetical protein